eukprot:SAG22_NODE_13158_length_416_cov_1.652997_1_plen_75_part_10
MNDMILFNVASQSIDRLCCTSRTTDAGGDPYNSADSAAVAIAGAGHGAQPGAYHVKETSTAPAFTFINGGSTGLQ